MSNSEFFIRRLAESQPLLDEQRQKVVSWNATWQTYPREACVHQLVARQAATTTDAEAVVSSGETLRYGELDRRANQLAHRLRSLGVGPEVIVGLCLRRCSGWVVGALGILKAGGAYLPLDPDFPPDRLDFALQDAQVSVVVTESRIAECLHASRSLQMVNVSDSAARQESSAPPVNHTTARNLAYVIYTSGSTGRPKGVEVTHDSLLNLLFWHRRVFSVSSLDRASLLAGLGFDASVWELWPYITAGASVHLPDGDAGYVPEDLRDWLLAEGITVTFVPTPLAERMIVLPWPAITPLRLLLTGADTLHRYPSPSLPFQVFNNYGPTECTVVATSCRVVPNTRPDRLPSIGTPIDNTQIFILDQNLQMVPIGDSGEIYVGGAGLARGYRNRPDLTADKFIPHPFSDEPGARLYKTGDLARFLATGHIEFLGRSDDQVKIQGCRVELDEIVGVLNGHQAVQASALMVREDQFGEKRLIAYVVLAPESQPSARELRNFLRAHLPHYMVPAIFVRLETLPLTYQGKVDRQALPAANDKNTLQDHLIVKPNPAIAWHLAHIIATLLRVDQISLHDNFFAIGGDSLLGARVVTKVREAFGVNIGLRTVFDRPVVADLAEQIERVILLNKETTAEDGVQHLNG